MAYVRKTEDEYDIEGNYGQSFEIVTCEITRKLAKDTIKTYRTNEPGIAFRIRHHRVPKEANPAMAPNFYGVAGSGKSFSTKNLK